MPNIKVMKFRRVKRDWELKKNQFLHSITINIFSLVKTSHIKYKYIVSIIHDLKQFSCKLNSFSLCVYLNRNTDKKRRIL